MTIRIQQPDGTWNVITYTPEQQEEIRKRTEEAIARFRENHHRPSERALKLKEKLDKLDREREAYEAEARRYWHDNDDDRHSNGDVWKWLLVIFFPPLILFAILDGFWG